MRKFIFTVTGWLFTIPFVLIALCFYPFYVLFRGITDEFVFNDYCELLKSVLYVINYNVEYWVYKKNKYKETAEELAYYRKLYKEMNDRVEEYEKRRVSNE